MHTDVRVDHGRLTRTSGHRLRVAIAAIATLTIVALGLAASGASAGWQPSVNVEDGTSDHVALPQIAAGRDGTVAVVWLRHQVDNDVVRVAIQPPGGRFGPAEVISNPLTMATVADVKVDAQGNTTAVWIAANIVYAAYHPVGGSWSSPQALSTSRDASLPTLAVGANGGAIIAWRRNPLSFYYEIDAAIRPSGATTFGPAARVSNTTNYNMFAPRAAMDSAGDVAVIWQRTYDTGGTTRAVAEASAKGASQDWPSGEPGLVSLSSTTSGSAGSGLYDVVMTPTGRVLTIWDWDSGNTGDPGRQGVYIADRLPTPSFDEAVWSPSVLVSDPTVGSLQGQIAMDDAGDAAALWSTFASSTVTGSVRPATGTFSVGQPLSSPFETNGMIASSPVAAEAMAVWKGTTGTNTSGLFSSYRAPGKRFSDREIVASGGDTSPTTIIAQHDIAVDGNGRFYVSFLRFTPSPAVYYVQTVTYEPTPPPPPDNGNNADDGSGAGRDEENRGADTSAADRAQTVTKLPVSPPAAVVARAGRARPEVKIRLLRYWSFVHGRTKLTRLKVIGAHVGDVIVLSCSGRGCGRSRSRTIIVRKVTQGGGLTLIRYVRRLALAPGARLTVTIRRREFGARIFSYAIRFPRSNPRITVLCLPPGARAPRAC